jgi:hypothetical protein
LIVYVIRSIFKLKKWLKVTINNKITFIALVNIISYNRIIVGNSFTVTISLRLPKKSIFRLQKWQKARLLRLLVVTYLQIKIVPLCLTPNKTCHHCITPNQKFNPYNLPLSCFYNFCIPPVNCLRTPGWELLKEIWN